MTQRSTQAVQSPARFVTVLIESWRAHPLAWIHRAEARAIAEELRVASVLDAARAA